MTRGTAVLTTCAILIYEAIADCLSDQELNDYFENIDGTSSSIPRFGSCCMYDVCGLQCPESNPSPAKGVNFLAICSLNGLQCSHPFSLSF